MSAGCQLPKCEKPAVDHGMCRDHQKVHVSSTGSWVDDNHLEGGHG